MGRSSTKRKIYCEKCKSTYVEDSFYKSNLEKYAKNNGYMNICKKCITMNVDNWDADTYLPILQEADVPYIPRVWNKLLKTYCQDPAKVNGMTVIGRYLGAMRMAQYKKYRWNDTEYLMKVEDNEKEVSMRQQGKTESEIQKTLEEDRAPLEKPEIFKEAERKAAVESATTFSSSLASNTQSAEELGLNEDDINYLSIKWGSSYSPDEWVKLEQLWVEMNESYDIQTAGERDSLKMICKTSLKAHQLIDLGDVDGFQKLTRVYETLMKQNKFTSSQLRDESKGIDCLGKFVALCEQEGGFIPQYYTPEPQDRVDETLADTKRYLRTLVQTESSLDMLIESAIKAIEKENDHTEQDAIDEIMKYADEDPEYSPLEDYQELRAFEEQELAADIEREEEDGA